MSTTLPLFWHLSSVTKKERIDASVKLVSSLEQFQIQFTQKAAPVPTTDDDEDEEESAPKSDGLDLINAQDVSYSIRRLIRGLASSREQSRLGFAVAFTELLSRLDTVTCSQITSLIKESTKNQGSMTGQEERAVLFAQLFGLMSIIQSGLTVRTSPLAASASSSTAASSLESHHEIITQLVELGDKKSWLRESAWFAISLALDALNQSTVAWKDEAFEKALVLLFKSNTYWSTEKVALALKLQGYRSQADWKTLLAPVFKNGDIMSSTNLSSLARILKESATDEDGPKDSAKAPAGAWKPQLNFAWDIILDKMLPGPNSQKPAIGSFQDFFRVIVDEGLFSSTSSAQRKYWGFQVFQKALKRVDENSLPLLFTKNFMRSWINHLSNRDRYLHKVAQQTASEVQTFVTDKPQLGFALILQLTGKNGSHQFDKLTRTKTFENILSSLDSEGIQSYINHLFSQVDEVDPNNSDVAVTNSRRSWIIEQFGGLIRNGSVPKNDTWVQSILEWLIVHGLFVINKKSSKSGIPHIHALPKPAFSDDLRKSCRNRLLSSLSDLGNQVTVVKTGDKVAKLAAVASDGEFWISKVISTIEQLEMDTKHVSLLTELDKDEVSLHTKALETVAQLRMISGSQQESAKGAELLLLGILLQRYCAVDDEKRLDLEALEACIDATSRMLLPEATKKGNPAPAEGASAESAEDPVDVLVDTIIGFLEKSTSYMRTVGNQVFSLLTDSMKEGTIDLILAQLQRRNPSELLEDEEEAMDVDESAEDEDQDQDDEGEDDPSSDEDGDDFDGDSNAEEADLELRSKIEEALRVNGIEPATGETDSEEEELMDDDQMMAIDEQLAQVFKSRTEERKPGKNINAQREATHFKNRVLDLVDLYLKKQPANALVLRFIIPMVELVAGSSQDERQLADKATGILRQRFGKSKEVPSEADVEQISLIGNQLHGHARKSHSSDLLSILSMCSLHLGKILVQLKADETLQDLYKQSLADFSTRKNSSLSASFFQDFVRRFPPQAWAIRQDLIKQCRRAINAYRKCQILQLLDKLYVLLPSMTMHDDQAIAFMPLVRDLLFNTANEACSDDGTLSAAQVKELLKTVLVCIRQHTRVSPSTIRDVWGPSAWKTLQTTLQESRFQASKSLHILCDQIIRAMDKSVIDAAPPKRKAEDSGEGDELMLPVPKKAKRKKVRVKAVDRD